jgi:sigma-B regulation protein RsbU (phosphoserine phosphatase)
MPRLLAKIEALLNGKPPGVEADPPRSTKVRELTRAPAAAAPAPAPAPPAAPAREAAPGTILVVDDTEANRRMLQRRLRRQGFVVEVAADGETALGMLNARTFDAVLLDVMMPGISGLDVLRRVRQRRDPTDLPVIMATAKDQSADIVEALEAGANDYVTKPLDFPVVLARLRTHLSLKRLVDHIRRLEQGLEQRNRDLQFANEKLRADLEAAGKVQAALLPAANLRAPGYQFRWLFHPSDALGGDILNVFRLDDKHVGLYVLDVSGHGVAAALLSVTVSHFLSPRPDPSSLLWRSRDGNGKFDLETPARVAQRLNHRFPYDAIATHFFTLVYGVLDLQTHELRYVSAGHPNLIHIPLGQSARVLEAAGYPIGIMEEEYAEYTLQLGPGDRLFAFSDGIMEALNANVEAFGQVRVMETLENARNYSIDLSMEVLSQRVEQWAGTEKRKDDQSILAMERAPFVGA